MKLLGKGGCGIVWLGRDTVGIRYAIKQFSKSGVARTTIESCQREIRIGKEIKKWENENIVSYQFNVQDSKDWWVVYDVGGESLSKLLFEMKGEFFRGERIYNITRLPLFTTLKDSEEALKSLLRGVLNAVDQMSSKNIVHADLKPDNVLVDLNCDFPTEFRIIDFGSAFEFNGTGGINSVTPEYMPPEALASGVTIQELRDVSHPWSFDIWSTGMIFLEIVHGFPLWMSLKSRVATPKGH
jgi:serine/threonine protein kinase